MGENDGINQRRDPALSWKLQGGDLAHAHIGSEEVHLSLHIKEQTCK